MKKLPTPEECFLNLPGFSSPPNYLEDLPGFNGIRVHYIESVHKLWFSKEVVIPAKAGIQSFQDLLDAGSSPA